MRKKKLGKILGVLAVCAVIVLIVILGKGPDNFQQKYEGVDLSQNVGEIGRTDTYEKYLSAHSDAPSGTQSIAVDVLAFEGDAHVDADHPDSVFTPDGSTVTWHVDVPEAGMYRILLDYLTVNSRGVDMERELYINGSLPFSGASQLCFSRLWTNAGPVRQDNQGNDIRPSQVEVFDWQQVDCKDDMGYETEPYQFYFDAGESTLSLKAVNEPMIIRGITLVPSTKVRSYAEYKESIPAGVSAASADYRQIIQGEDSTLRSSPSLYARYDRSSPSTVPYSVTNTIMNYIGGDPWNNAGQWIEWGFDIEEDGLYNISIKARQAYQRGSLSCRNFYLDGEAPFSEVETLTFDYNTSWDMRTLCDESGKPFQFYLTKGHHTVRLEATLGGMGPVLERLEDSIFELNQIYRKILVLTGVNPDRFRDYNLFKIYPDVKTAMDLAGKRLYKIVDDTVAITGQKSDRVAVAQTLAVQLEGFVNHEERITQSFGNFKDNITSLGTAMQNMAETKLDIDMIVISGDGAKLPSTRDGFLAKALHEIRSCVASYFVDYNSIGDKFEENETDDLIEVWIVTGRDQSTILKTMVDDTFTPNTGIRANVKLVVADTLLTAVVAGNGPDVVLSVGSWFPVNYAMRHAVEDLTQFPDYEQVVAPFYDSAMTPMIYDGGVYALPETQEFSVLFYREDVLEELGLKPPQTWDEVIAMLPTIQGNNMSVGIPYPDIASADLSILNSMIYQNGGQIYDDEGKKTCIDSENGVNAFKLYTSLYNDYGLPTVYDFVSRFRSGEMPIGVAPYSVYNTLTVSAPEIRGLWDFTLFPGTMKAGADGKETLDRSVHCAGLCSMIIATDNEQVKKNSWEFLKWWTSSEAQVRFGREIESVLGSSARYTTANREALDQLAWSAAQLSVLKEQMAQTVGFREIAGGYSTTRHMTNAIRRVINDKDDARETLLMYSKTINEEIKVKRREFNLPVD